MNPRKQRFYIAAAALMAVIALVYSMVGSPVVLWHNHQLKTALTGLTDSSITLEQAVPFSWDEVYSFAPYTSLEEMEATIGTESYNLTESVSEGMLQLVFLDEGAVAAAVCAAPADLGYELIFSDWEGNAAHLTYGENVSFGVRSENGITVLEQIAE